MRESGRRRNSTGVRESAQRWRELLIGIQRRGLKIAPDLAVSDGATRL